MFIYNGKELKNGECCPHCSRKTNLAALQLNSSHAYALGQMYKKGQLKYHNYKDVTHKGHTDFTIMKHWNLIKPKANLDESKIGSGEWALTYDGIEFILGNKKIPREKFVFNKEVIGSGHKEISFEDLANKKFDIREVRASNITTEIDHSSGQLRFA